MKSYPFTSILGWSSSRFDTFSLCKRKYFYSYYSKFDNEFPKELIDRLKRLTTEPLVVGELTHDVIKTTLERLQHSSKPIDMPRFENHIKSLVNKVTGERIFFDSYYSNAIINVAKITEEIITNVKSLLDSNRFLWLNAIDMNQRKSWIIEPAGFGETRIGDLKAYCKVDALIPHEGKAYIFDWKTGKRDDLKHRKQLAGYALFAMKNLNYAASDIIPVVSYLKKGYEENQLELTYEEIENFHQLVQNETKEMYGFNSDIENNIPINKNEFQQISGGICSYCEFKELCVRA
jgi:hypothetical protein